MRRNKVINDKSIYATSQCSMGYQDNELMRGKDPDDGGRHPIIVVTINTVHQLNTFLSTFLQRRNRSCFMKRVVT